MSNKTKLEQIDTKLATAHQTIADAREAIKELSAERDTVVREVSVEDNLAKWEETQEAGRKWREANPEEHAAFVAEIKERNQEGVIEGHLNGWWDLDENGNMAAPAQVFKISDFTDVKNPLMAHVMVAMGIFPSVGQARKNGWDNPLVVGEWTVTKKKIRVKVID